MSLYAEEKDVEELRFLAALAELSVANDGVNSLALLYKFASDLRDTANGLEPEWIDDYKDKERVADTSTGDAHFVLVLVSAGYPFDKAQSLMYSMHHKLWKSARERTDKLLEDAKAAPVDYNGDIVKYINDFRASVMRAPPAQKTAKVPRIYVEVFGTELAEVVCLLDFNKIRR